MGANPVLRIGDAPDGHKPLIQAQRGILEDRPDLDAELLPAVLVLALVHSSTRNPPDVFRAADRAFRFSVRPLNPAHLRLASVQIRIVNNRLNQAFRGVAHRRFSVLRGVLYPNYNTVA